jgi:hypothetical protein
MGRMKQDFAPFVTSIIYEKKMTDKQAVAAIRVYLEGNVSEEWAQKQVDAVRKYPKLFRERMH